MVKYSVIPFRKEKYMSKKKTKSTSLPEVNQPKVTYDKEASKYMTDGPQPSKTLKGAFDVIESFVYAIVAVLVIFTFFIRLTIVDGPSMENTLRNGEYIVVSNIFFTYEPENGDIVVIHGDFENYLKNTYGADYVVNHNYSDPIIKRVIATGGQTIKIDLNTLETFVDGVKIDEEYAKFENFNHTMFNLPSLGEFRYDENGNIITDDSNIPIFFRYLDPETNIFEATVPEDHIFVMGDNRDHSADSRISDIGFIPNEFIVGKAIFRLSPFTTF